MTRINRHTPAGMPPLPPSDERKTVALDALPQTLPPKSHVSIKAEEMAKLIVPANLSLPYHHPLGIALQKVFVEMTLMAITTGGFTAPPMGQMR